MFWKVITGVFSNTIIIQVIIPAENAAKVPRKADPIINQLSRNAAGIKINKAKTIPSSSIINHASR